MRCSSDKRSGKGGASSIVPNTAVHRRTGGARKPLSNKRGACSTHAGTLHFLPRYLALGWLSSPCDEKSVYGNNVSWIRQNIGEDPGVPISVGVGMWRSLRRSSAAIEQAFSPADPTPESIGERQVISPLNRTFAARLLLVAWSAILLDSHIPAQNYTAFLLRAVRRFRALFQCKTR
ncbi:hypothetical protein BCV69DRAFT_71528 [Microstroma glucosiphilum]|uniref:Uncharacterized protein n=1 Tax=Pseudomicrostroma glucosiphilum TaxID=1684307 RepID=A0A316TYP2_9BASI|nr:hypothetical protein BCV69DRAFT_71528 [Pseudomicrostroma glucosiphilum]PWN18386.1 hypothetical protein BCV69DRAFT_71528 [Pseudomicrostroma glucosiphilum]